MKSNHILLILSTVLISLLVIGVASASENVTDVIETSDFEQAVTVENDIQNSDNLSDEIGDEIVAASEEEPAVVNVAEDEIIKDNSSAVSDWSALFGDNVSNLDLSNILDVNNASIDWTSLLNDTRINWTGLLSNPTFNMSGILNNPNIDLGVLLNNPAFDLSGIMNNPNFDLTVLLNNSGFDLSALLNNPNIDWVSLLKDSGIDWTALLNNPNFDLSKLLNNPNINWAVLLNNPGFDLSKLLNNPNIDWVSLLKDSGIDWAVLLNNPSFDFISLLNNPNFDWSFLFNNPDLILSSILNSPGIDWNGILNNPNINWEALLNNPSIDWTGILKKLNFDLLKMRVNYGNISIDVSKIINVIQSAMKKDTIDSADLTTYYAKTTQFKVTVSSDNKLVTKGYVIFTINNKDYVAKIGSDGVATLKIKLKPGTYDVTSSYGKALVQNKIVIKKSIITKNVSKKYKKTGKFTVKVLNTKGKPHAKQTVKMKLNGKTYTAKTNSKGIATFKLPKSLKVGKYTIKTICKGLTISNKLTVKK